MSAKKLTPTMKDVAREAGVALGTVSKVFNGIPVGEEYRSKVESAAEKLGYQVNSYARGLKTNKTNTVALILPNLQFPFFGHLANETATALKERGYRMIVATTDYDPEAEQDCIRMVQQNKVDGIICMSYNPNLEVDVNLPFISIDRYFDTSIPCVSSDNFYGGQLAAKKLSAFGCKKILFLRATSNVKGEADKRQLGFDAQCQMMGLEHQDIVIYDGDSWDIFWDYIDEHIVKYINNKKETAEAGDNPQSGQLPEFAGIFCNTDHLAYEALKYLRSKGVKVPEEIQIIGFDGIRKFGNEDFFVSTIVQPVKQMAETAVNMVLDENRTSLSPLMCLPVSYAYGGTTRDEQAAEKK